MQELHDGVALTTTTATKPKSIEKRRARPKLNQGTSSSSSSVSKETAAAGATEAATAEFAKKDAEVRYKVEEQLALKLDLEREKWCERELDRVRVGMEERKARRKAQLAAAHAFQRTCTTDLERAIKVAKEAKEMAGWTKAELERLLKVKVQSSSDKGGGRGGGGGGGMRRSSSSRIEDEEEEEEVASLTLEVKAQEAKSHAQDRQVKTAKETLEAANSAVASLSSSSSSSSSSPSSSPPSSSSLQQQKFDYVEDEEDVAAMERVALLYEAGDAAHAQMVNIRAHPPVRLYYLCLLANLKAFLSSCEAVKRGLVAKHAQPPPKPNVSTTGSAVHENGGVDSGGGSGSGGGSFSSRASFWQALTVQQVMDGVVESLTTTVSADGSNQASFSSSGIPFTRVAAGALTAMLGAIVAAGVGVVAALGRGAEFTAMVGDVAAAAESQQETSDKEGGLVSGGGSSSSSSSCSFEVVLESVARRLAMRRWEKLTAAASAGSNSNNRHQQQQAGSSPTLTTSSNSNGNSSSSNNSISRRMVEKWKQLFCGACKASAKGLDGGGGGGGGGGRGSKGVSAALSVELFDLLVMEGGGGQRSGIGSNDEMAMMVVPCVAEVAALADTALIAYAILEGRVFDIFVEQPQAAAVAAANLGAPPLPPPSLLLPSPPLLERLLVAAVFPPPPLPPPPPLLPSPPVLTIHNVAAEEAGAGGGDVDPSESESSSSSSSSSSPSSLRLNFQTLTKLKADVGSTKQQLGVATNELSANKQLVKATTDQLSVVESDILDLKDAVKKLLSAAEQHSGKAPPSPSKKKASSVRLFRKAQSTGTS
jgi:hypothetical protein